MPRDTKFFEPLDARLNVPLTKTMKKKIIDAAKARSMSVCDLARRKLADLEVPEINLGLIAELNNLRNAVNKHAGLFKHLHQLRKDYREETATALREAQKLYAQVVQDYEALRKKIGEEISK